MHSRQHCTYTGCPQVVDIALPRPLGGVRPALWLVGRRASKPRCTESPGPTVSQSYPAQQLPASRFQLSPGQRLTIPIKQRSHRNHRESIFQPRHIHARAVICASFCNDQTQHPIPPAAAHPSSQPYRPPYSDKPGRHESPTMDFSDSLYVFLGQHIIGFDSACERTCTKTRGMGCVRHPIGP